MLPVTPCSASGQLLCCPSWYPSSSSWLRAYPCGRHLWDRCSMLAFINITHRPGASDRVDLQWREQCLDDRALGPASADSWGVGSTIAGMTLVIEFPACDRTTRFQRNLSSPAVSRLCGDQQPFVWQHCAAVTTLSDPAQYYTVCRRAGL